jgi:hypothetical protein
MGVGGMFVIQTRNARVFRKSSVGFAILFVLKASLGALLTMHWYVPPPPK